MTNEEAIIQKPIEKVVAIGGRGQGKTLHATLELIEENIKLKAEIERLIAENKQSVKFKEYFMELYSQGLEVANWHLNGDLEPLMNFIDSACEEAELALKEVEDI